MGFRFEIECGFFTDRFGDYILALVHPQGYILVGDIRDLVQECLEMRVNPG